MTTKAVSKHAVLKIPHLVRDADAIMATAAEQQLDYQGAYAYLLQERERTIKLMDEDPLVYGYEPGIWFIVDALLGLDVLRPEWSAKTGMEWSEWAEEVRRHFGFEEPVQVAWLSGANRSGKSTCAAKRTVEVLINKKRAIVWCYDQSGPMSIDRQQAWIHGFLPKNVRQRRAIKTAVEYVNYNEHNGFTGQKFTLPDLHSKCEFRNYMQEAMLSEGGEIDLANCEENVPPDLLTTLKGRIGGDRKAKIMVPYTPINGWNGTVNLLMQTADVVKTVPAYFLPKDGGEPDIVRGFGFESEEQMRAAHADGRWSVPENCLAWLDEEPERPMMRKELERRPYKVGDRLFERMPRIMRNREYNAAIVFFHPMDNPFGNPWEVWKTWRNATSEIIRRRIYGWATETNAPVFRRFSDAVHVVPAAQIPKDGTNYLFIDPAGGRNWFFIWIRKTRMGKAYVYREWPGPYPIKDGLLGPWAEVSGKKEGVNDGKKGPAQESLGFTIREYMAEWARLEGWQPGWEKIVDRWLEQTSDAEPRDEYGDKVRQGIQLSRYRGGRDDGRLPYPDDGAKEKIAARIIDCRAANTASQSKQGVVTPLTVLEDMGIDCELSVPVRIGGHEESGIDLVNTLLAWDAEQPLGPDNCPDLMFSDACPNVIWSMQNWRNVDGNKGACKDPVDLIRYYAAGDYPYEG